jgi:hypothetical protein
MREGEEQINSGSKCAIEQVMLASHTSPQENAIDIAFGSVSVSSLPPLMLIGLAMATPFSGYTKT